MDNQHQRLINCNTEHKAQLLKEASEQVRKLSLEAMKKLNEDTDKIIIDVDTFLCRQKDPMSKEFACLMNRLGSMQDYLSDMPYSKMESNVSDSDRGHIIGHLLFEENRSERSSYPDEVGYRDTSFSYLTTDNFSENRDVFDTLNLGYDRAHSQQRPSSTGEFPSSSDDVTGHSDGASFPSDPRSSDKDSDISMKSSTSSGGQFSSLESDFRFMSLLQEQNESDDDD